MSDVKVFVAIACVLGSALLAGAQPAPAKPQQPTAKPSTAPAQAAPAPRRPAQPTVTRLKVGDFSGQPLGDVSVQISGTETTDARTDDNGVSVLRLKAGSYRLRFTHDEFITLERDITVRAGRPEEISVTLSRAPAPPPAPQPVPPPPPPPVVEPEVPAGSPANVSIPRFLDKNFIGREPLKESVVGCTADATTRVLQLHDSIATHVHPDLDEVLYVVAGTGAIRIGDQVTDVAAGSLSVIPRRQRHAIERKGKNPLIVLSTVAGAPCQAATLTRP
jgi:mannose-6-phosphate isomerase-like protein (cupin superfamily)